TIQADQSIEEARQLGRDDNAVNRLSVTGNLIREDQTIPLSTNLDLNRLNACFDSVDADINNPAVNAGIVVDGTDVSFTPDSTGIVVDRDAAKAKILGVLKDLKPIDTTLPTMVDQPDIRQADLEAGKEKVQDILSEPVRI